MSSGAEIEVACMKIKALNVKIKCTQHYFRKTLKQLLEDFEDEMPDVNIITDAEFTQIMTAFKQALPVDIADPSSLGRIRSCTLLPVATAAPSTEDSCVWTPGGVRGPSLNRC